MSKLTLEEIEGDLNATERDIVVLDMIVQNLGAFIQHSHGEDRSGFKMDLFKYRALADQARGLREQIKLTRAHYL